MEIDTPFGRQTISPDDIIQFVNGIPGFEDRKRFKLFRENENADVVMLQSVDDATLTLSATDPAKLRVQYQISLNEDEARLLESTGPEDLLVLVLLYRSETGNEDEAGKPIDLLRANLLGPIIINPTSRLAMQKVLNNIEQTVTIKSG